MAEIWMLSLESWWALRIVGHGKMVSEALGVVLLLLLLLLREGQLHSWSRVLGVQALLEAGKARQRRPVV